VTAQNIAALDKVRAAFMKIADDKTAQKQIQELAATMAPSAVLNAYLGFVLAMQASTIFNPIKKLGRFLTATKKIDTAAKKEPLNLEIRFIRYILQSNPPAMIGYNQYLKADLAVIVEQLSKGAYTEDLEAWVQPIINEVYPSQYLSSEQKTQLDALKVHTE